MTNRLPRLVRRDRGGVWALTATFAGMCVAGCAPSREPRPPLEMEPIGTVAHLPQPPSEPDDGSTVTTPNSGTPNPVQETACSGGDFDSLDEVLRRCEGPMPKPADLPRNIGKRLQIRVRADAPTVSVGGRLELTLTLQNVSKEPLPLYFSGTPVPRFDVEAVDGNGRRVDVPRGKAPAWPKGKAPDASSVRAARVTLAPGASGTVKIPWRAVTYRWAPELASSWEGRGYPRAVDGKLPKGRYTLRFIVPLLGVFEKGALEIPILAVTVR